MLSNLVKLKKKRKVIGRGGDKGGTCGKGHKGQKARSGGGVRTQFEGGQTPLTRRLPKHGFNNYEFRKEYQVVSLDNLQKIASNNNLTILKKEDFVEYGIIKNVKERVKILNNGKLTISLTVEAESFSSGAKKAIELIGGTVKILS